MGSIVTICGLGDLVQNVMLEFSTILSSSIDQQDKLLAQQFAEAFVARFPGLFLCAIIASSKPNYVIKFVRYYSSKLTLSGLSLHGLRKH